MKLKIMDNKIIKFKQMKFHKHKKFNKIRIKLKIYFK